MHGFALWQRFFHDATGNVFSLRFIKVEQTVHAAICAFAFAFPQRARADERQRPMLKLEFIELSESLSALEVRWLTFFFELDRFAECVFQSPLDQIDREVGDVDAYPLSIEFFRRVNGRAASAERMEHRITRIR